MTSYAYNYGFESVIYRLANIVGSMARHGLSATSLGSCWKTLRNSRFLEMEPGKVMSTRWRLVGAILFGLNVARERVEIFNVGSEDQITVEEIAGIVCMKMGLKGVRYMFTGGVDGGRET